MQPNCKQQKKFATYAFAFHASARFSAVEWRKLCTNYETHPTGPTPTWQGRWSSGFTCFEVFLIFSHYFKGPWAGRFCWGRLHTRACHRVISHFPYLPQFLWPFGVRLPILAPLHECLTPPGSGVLIMDGKLWNSKRTKETLEEKSETLLLTCHAIVWPFFTLPSCAALGRQWFS